MMTTKQVEELLGKDAASLLGHQCKTVSKEIPTVTITY